MIFSGKTATLKFDVSQMVTPASQIYARIDNGALTHYEVNVSSITLSIQSELANLPYHTLEVIVKSSTERANRWLAGPSTRIVFTGLELDVNAKLSTWIPAPKNVLIYGDSITEGVLTMAGSQPRDTDHNDVTMCYSWRLGALLGAEIGVIGFGATGLSRGGSGNVPALGVSWNQVWDGVPRSFSPKYVQRSTITTVLLPLKLYYYTTTTNTTTISTTTTTTNTTTTNTTTTNTTTNTTNTTTTTTTTLLPLLSLTMLLVVITTY